MGSGNGKPLRCAIYTRKSTEEGLEQEFNSLDAQRAACAAYIQSQMHEGWSLIAEHYDDGGFSGGNMDRPALRHLLADVMADKVDVIVVYKVDRLTRSLSDFARIVDVIDECDASFVSVTQAFNTTTSMGRLTLNVLLSFAQFEREVTSERIRDKIAASKARGMWMGGNVPLGYDVEDRKLLVNEKSAATVRMIFERYLAVGSVVALAREIEKAGIRSPQRLSRSGRSLGGAVFSNGALAAILRNRIYIGDIVHKGQPYPGNHDAIIDRELFEAVNELLASNRANTIAGLNADHPSLLAGLVWDVHGRRMIPDHASKRGKRYRYYASKKTEETRQKPFRVPAGDLEGIVLAQLQRRSSAPGVEKEENGRGELLSRAQLPAHIDRIVVDVNRIDLHFVEPDILGNKQIEVPVQLARSGKEVRLAEPPSAATVSRRNPALIKLVVKAHAARQALEGSAEDAVPELAAASGYSSDYFRVLLRVSYLAPDIVAAILEGRQPAHLNRQRLARATNLPIDWQAQRQALGF